MPGQSLAQMIRAKYPGAYTDLSDQELERKIRAKFPGQYDDLPLTQDAPKEQPSKPNWYDTMSLPIAGQHVPFRGIVEAGIGALKGAGNTAINLGGLVQEIPGVSRAVDTLYGQSGVSSAAFAPDSPVREAVKPTNAAQQLGYGAEQIAEYFVPAGQAEKVATAVASKLPKYARLLPQLGAQATSSAGVAAAQGGDPTTAAALGVGVPVAGAGIGATARWAGSKAEPLVRAAIKPTVTAMKRVAGASTEGLDAKANQLVRFVIENKVTTAEKARTIFQQAEQELQRVLAVKNAPTDVPARALRYLEALERSASKQGLGADDVATIRNAMAELVEGPMGRDVVTMVPQAHPTLVGANGKPITVLVPQTSRALRPDMPAQEAMSSARASSQWSTRKQWGEQKGVSMEAQKAVERAERDAVKTAVPESRDLLQREDMAIRAGDVLDRMAFRTGNRDALSLPAHVAAAGGIAAGNPAGAGILAFAANWLRNNQLQAGMWADALRRGVARGDVQTVATAMERLGIAVPSAASGR